MLLSRCCIYEVAVGMQSAYSMPKDEAIALLAQFSAAPGIAVSDHARGVLALPNLSRAKPGFVDRLIHGQAAASNAALVTFEEAAAQLPNTIVLE